MFQEFKTFIARGNVLDLAVGVIIGGGFGKIVSSLTDDVIMPVIGKFNRRYRSRRNKATFKSIWASTKPKFTSHNSIRCS